MGSRPVCRRHVLLGLGSAAGVAVLAACGATPTPQVVKETVIVEKESTVVVQATSAAPTALEWWPGWPDAFMVAIAKKFEEANPDIRVNVVSNYPEMQAVLAAVAAGTPPDIIADVPYMELIARGVILPLDERINTSSEVSLTDGDIRKELWEVFAWQGEHYGIPSVDTAGREGIGYNLDVVEAAGLSSSALPETWDDVFAWHEQITKFDDAGNLTILGMAVMAERTDACAYGDPWMWPHMWGFKYVENNTYSIDRPETIEFLKVIKEFSDSVGVEKIDGLSQAMAGISRGAFGIGKQGMQITYPSGPAGVHQSNPMQRYKFTYVPMPASRKGKKIQTAGGHAGIIMKDAKSPDAAFKLAAYLTSKEACDILYASIGWIGVRKSWQAQVDLSQYPEDVAQNIMFFQKSLDEADEVWYNQDPVEGITGTEWGKAFQGVMQGTLTPEEAAAQMQANLQKELNNVLGV
jgi:ABC-type glycerol-3-phosphate transport system substrate-binding protein